MTLVTTDSLVPRSVGGDAAELPQLFKQVDGGERTAGREAPPS
jgi:hypothetical protein